MVEKHVKHKFCVIMLLFYLDDCKILASVINSYFAVYLTHDAFAYVENFSGFLAKNKCNSLANVCQITTLS